jgi:ankyrin repeat protein|uniref:Uncharacterized protein n=1 Tax=Globisporangium ultimum (strain ATCC 200006 / CBS 805.95 / DAOM BR144) TaxID=431595 RepID=K3XAA5_GLOUD
MSSETLRDAICDGDMVSVHRLVEVEGASVDYVSIDDGWPLLLWAIKANQPECLEFLLAKGANFHIGDSSGNTALHKAAYLGHELLVRILIKHGATVDARNLTNQTPADLAEIFDRKHIMALLATYHHEPQRHD